MNHVKRLMTCSLLVLNSCQLPASLEKTIGNTVDNLKRLTGISIQHKSDPDPATAQDSAPKTKANAELLAEMVQVVYKTREFDDLNQFNGLVSSLNQGASLEGIYRGLVMGARYRVLESKSKAATPDALKFFAIELAGIQAEMKQPTRFDRETAKLAPSIEYPEGDLGETPDQLDFTPASEGTPAQKTKDQVVNELLQIFIGATPFTLKRILADEAMKKMDELSGGSGEVAQWYANLVIRLCQTHVDFGLPQRNQAEFDFHFRFAKTMAIDRVKWEVVNRYHRILNELDHGI